MLVKFIHTSLCLMVLLHISISTCLAVNTTQKWEPLCTTNINNQLVDFFIDSQSYNIHEGADKYIDCWIKSVSDTGVVIQHFSVKEKDLSYIIDEYIINDKNGKQIEAGTSRSRDWRQLASYSKMELLLMDIVVWTEKQNKEDADKTNNSAIPLKEWLYSSTKINLDTPDLSLSGPVKQVSVTPPHDPVVSSDKLKIFRFSKKGLLIETQEWKKNKLNMQSLFDDRERELEQYSYSDGYKKRMNSFIYDDSGKQYMRFKLNSIEKGTLDEYGKIATVQYDERQVDTYNFIYNELGWTIQTIVGSNTTDIEYDVSGRVTRQYGGLGELMYVYDEQGNPIKYVVLLRSMPKLVITYINQEFDDYGNWTKRLLYKEVNEVEKPIEIQTRTIEYYQQEYLLKPNILKCWTKVLLIQRR